MIIWLLIYEQMITWNAQIIYKSNVLVSGDFALSCKGLCCQCFRGTSLPHTAKTQKVDKQEHCNTTRVKNLLVHRDWSGSKVSYFLFNAKESCIVTLSMEALLHRKPASTGTSCNNGVQDTNTRN